VQTPVGVGQQRVGRQRLVVALRVDGDGRLVLEIAQLDDRARLDVARPINDVGDEREAGHLSPSGSRPERCR
jgi:hypothetical protein